MRELPCIWCMLAASQADKLPDPFHSPAKRKSKQHVDRVLGHRPCLLLLAAAGLDSIGRRSH